MQSLEPLINLLVLLTVLSVAAERATNLRKLSQPETRTRATNPDEERTREAKIAKQSAVMGVLLSLLVKADLFERARDSIAEAAWRIGVPAASP